MITKDYALSIFTTFIKVVKESIIVCWWIIRPDKKVCTIMGKHQLYCVTDCFGYKAMSKAFFDPLGKRWAMALENKFGDSCVFRNYGPMVKCLYNVCLDNPPELDSPKCGLAISTLCGPVIEVNIPPPLQNAVASVLLESPKRKRDLDFSPVLEETPVKLKPLHGLINQSCLREVALKKAEKLGSPEHTVILCL
jgi:hypothetical protein